MARPFGGVKKQSGWYQAYYPGPDGKRVHERTRFETYDDARAWLDDLARDRARGDWTDRAAGAQRFDVFATSWLATHRIASTTRELYASYLDNHILPTLGLLELRQISPPVVRQWYASLESTTGPTARARSYALLRTIMNVAVDDGAIPSNPCRIRGASTVRHKPRPAPNLDEVRRIAARMPKRYRALVILAVASTARFGELVALRRRDLDLDRMTVTVARQWYKGEYRETKRPESDRTVYLPATIRGILEAHLRLYVHPSPDALVFTTRNGTPPPTSWINRVLREAATPVGLEGLTFHSLRHAGGTLAAQTGATTRELMRRMGQSTPRAAMIYQHAADERDALIAKRLAEGAASGGNVIPLHEPRSSGRSDRRAR